MTTSFSKEQPGDNSSLVLCQRLASQLRNGVVTFVEYAYNVTLAMISIPDDYLDQAVSLISPDVLVPYLGYLGEFLEPADYMPCPKPFIAGIASDDEIER